MPTPIAAAANAYASLARLRGPAVSLVPNIGGDAKFGEILKDIISAVSQTAHKSDLQSQAVAAGKANMVDVVTAVAETETTIQTLVSVRDKVIAAYEDILKMPI